MSKWGKGWGDGGSRTPDMPDTQDALLRSGNDIAWSATGWGTPIPILASAKRPKLIPLDILFRSCIKADNIWKFLFNLFVEVKDGVLPQDGLT